MTTTKEPLIYQAKNGALELRGDVNAKTVWATQRQMADVFDVNVPAINKHIKNILKEKELNVSTISILEIVQKEGKRAVIRKVEHYNLDELYADPYVKNRKGVFEFILGGAIDTKLLNVRVFDEATKKSVYREQTVKAEKKEESNCPLCALGHDANKDKIWKIDEMDADHVAAWSKGGTTDAKNCQMLCKTHNRAKGNR